jgi:hypothetical protein
MTSLGKNSMAYPITTSEIQNIHIANPKTTPHLRFAELAFSIANTTKASPPGLLVCTESGFYYLILEPLQVAFT